MLPFIPYSEQLPLPEFHTKRNLPSAVTLDWVHIQRNRPLALVMTGAQTSISQLAG
jgi:hypothetical protein